MPLHDMLQHLKSSKQALTFEVNSFLIKTSVCGERLQPYLADNIMVCCELAMMREMLNTFTRVLPVYLADDTSLTTSTFSLFPI